MIQVYLLQQLSSDLMELSRSMCEMIISIQKRLILVYYHMNKEGDYREQFLRAEAAIGITKENYCKKFIYNPGQTNDNYLLDRFSATPSQLQGFSIEQEKCMGYIMSQLIFKSAQSLRLPASTAVVAASVSHFFFSRVGYMDYDLRDVAMGAMFLACKSQQTLRKSYQVSSVFDYVFKVFEGQKMPIKIQVLNSNEYDYMRKKVLELEKQILFELGFEIYRLFDIPHRYIGGLFKSFERHPQCKKICQQAWIFLNDFYKTNVCLYYPGQVIAAASVYMSLLRLKIKMPTVAWWVLLQANIESIEELIGELQFFYQCSKTTKSSLQKVAGYINEVGERNDLINVFPVSYSRKVLLDNSNQLRVRKIVKVPEPISSVQKDDDVNSKNEEEMSDRSSQHKKKKKDKKKKDKKDKKDKKKKKDKQSKKYEEDDEESQKDVRSRSREKRKDSSSKSQKPAYDFLAESPLRMANESTLRSASPNTVKKIEQSSQNEKKQMVRQMKVESAKGLLSKISNQLNQLKKTELKKPTEKQIHSDSMDEEDEEALAELIKIKKNKQQKKS